MTIYFSRRSVLAMFGGAIATSYVGGSVPDVPPLLDHILLGCNDLQRGIEFVEHHTGVRAAFGGVHPGRGTQNALLSLGERRYLEVIAPDPQQSSTEMPWLQHFAEPRLVGWAAHPSDLDALAKHLRQSGVVFEGPRPGSRKTPDGRTLQWETLTLKENPGWLLPFFIRWSPDSVHPSVEAPKGCRLLRFAAATPKLEELQKTAAALQLDIRISLAKNSALQATISGPKGEFTATS